MIETTADFLPIWMALSAAFGFLAGEAVGDSRRHRKCLEQINAFFTIGSQMPALPNSRYTRSSNSSAASSTTSTRKLRP